MKFSMMNVILFKKLIKCRNYHSGIVEIRTYEAIPEKLKEYIYECQAIASVRHKYLAEMWKLYLLAETGYGSLADLIHIYHYKGGLEERQDKRKQMSSDLDWIQFLESSRPLLKQQRSEIFIPAKIELPDYNIPCLTMDNDNKYCNSTTSEAVYEIRHYQLKPGYDSVPKLIEIFQRGLPDKLKHCDEKTGQLMLLAHSDVGILNQFIEIWRYPNAAASITHRESSRKALKWREAINEAAKITVTFQNRLMLPSRCSPLK